MVTGKQIFFLVLCYIAGGMTDAANGGHSRTTRNDLVGAWRLLSIDVAGPHGPERDPFYGAGSAGLLIYDQSGWFSAQISGRSRPPLDVPASRPEPENVERDKLKAAALDSYYAYFGTWSFNAATSTVTHHVKGALYSDELNAIYAQQVEVQGRKLIFTRTQGIPGHVTVQTKVWERCGDEIDAGKSGGASTKRRSQMRRDNTLLSDIPHT